MKISIDALSDTKLESLITDGQTFEVTGLSSGMSDAVARIENAIESAGLRCRVYTYGRVAATGASFFGGVTGLVGLASTVGIAAHNLATLNPDYEIAKHMVDNMLTVKYCKS